MDNLNIPPPNNITAPRVTRDQIDKLMEQVEYRFDRPHGTTSTFCHAFLKSKDGSMFYLTTGHNACISPHNFSEQTGMDLSRAKATHQAYDKLWEFSGFALFKEIRDAQY